jgi:hypothetical protein
MVCSVVDLANRPPCSLTNHLASDLDLQHPQCKYFRAQRQTQMQFIGTHFSVRHTCFRRRSGQGSLTISALIIFLDSVTRPTSRASTKTLKGTNLKRIGQFCHYLSGHLSYIQLLHDAATTSILNSNLIQSTVPQHRKARRKRRHVGSYRYHRYLVTTHFWNPPCDTGGSAQRRVYVSEGDRRVCGSPQRGVCVSEGDQRVALESGTRQMTHWQLLPQEPPKWNPFALLSPRA